MATATTAPEKAPKTLKLPDALRMYHDQLVKALAAPIFYEWDDANTYAAAKQPEAIGAVLVRALHDELANAEIGYVFRKKLTDRDRTRLAQASRVGGKLNYFSQLDCLIEVNHEAWCGLSAERKIALIDHELSHFSREIDDEGATTYKLLSHDVEEFSAIVRRWGLWEIGLERFGHAVERARQIDIFAPIDPGSEPRPAAAGSSVTFGDVTIAGDDLRRVGENADEILRREGKAERWTGEPVRVDANGAQAIAAAAESSR